MLMCRNNKLLDILISLFLFLTVLNCNSVYNQGTLFKCIVIIWNTILILLFIISLCNIPRNEITNLFIFNIIFLIFISSFLFFNYMQYHYDLFDFILLLLIDPIMLITVFVTQLSENHFDRYVFCLLENIIILLAIISLIFWICALIGINTNMSKIINWGSIHSIPGYFGIDFIAQGTTSFLGIPNIIRNTGIFNEAPMYSYVLCIALFIDLFIRNAHPCVNWRSLILLITILSTTSTTGIMISIPAILYKLFITSKKINMKLVIILLIPISIMILKYILSFKLSNPDDIYSSYNGRMNDIFAAISAWKNHIIIGNGINNESSLIPYMYSWRILSHNTGLSNGFFAVLAYGGILYSLFFIMPVILSYKYSKYVGGLALFSFILFIYTMIQHTYIWIFLLSYFMACYIVSLGYNKIKDYNK